MSLCSMFKSCQFGSRIHFIFGVWIACHSLHTTLHYRNPSKRSYYIACVQYFLFGLCRSRKQIIHCRKFTFAERQITTHRMLAECCWRFKSAFENFERKLHVETTIFKKKRCSFPPQSITISIQMVTRAKSK